MSEREKLYLEFLRCFQRSIFLFRSSSHRIDFNHFSKSNEKCAQPFFGHSSIAKFHLYSFFVQVKRFIVRQRQANSYSFVMSFGISIRSVFAWYSNNINNISSRRSKPKISYTQFLKFISLESEIIKTKICPEIQCENCCFHLNYG